MDRSGSRGGTTESLEEAQALFEKWKAEEYGGLKVRILYEADQHGEFHGSQLAELQIGQPNLIGAAVQSLTHAGLIENRNRLGQVEHRKSPSMGAAHGRASYVWRLTPSGQSLVAALEADPELYQELLDEFAAAPA